MSRPPPAIPTRRCGGRARAHGRWRWRSTVWATASATRWSPSCCTDWATACRATPRLVRAASMSIGTRSFGTSPGACDARNGNSSRRFRWTPRRRSWSARSRTRPHLAPGEDAAAGTGRLRDPGHRHHGREGHSVWHLRSASQRRRVRVGIDHDTASFAVRRSSVGGSRVARRRSLLITADAGGSNGARLRLWKWELQRLANRTGLVITVCHFPPGTSKWNKIEHRLFSHIAMNWRGTPLVDLATIGSLIGSTHSRSGLRVRSELDRAQYPGRRRRHVSASRPTVSCCLSP